MKIKYLMPDDIKITDRSRTELGDIDGLLESILSNGLIHPITVNANMKLLAGSRRLAAFKQGMKTHPTNKYMKRGVPTLIRPTTDILEEKEIELMENLARKDMTWHEKNKLTAEIHALFDTKLGKGVNTIKATADLIGRSRSSVSQSLEMHRAVEAVPELATMPSEDKARRAYKKLIEDIAVKRYLKDVPKQKVGKPKSSKQSENKDDWAEINIESMLDQYVVGDTLKLLPKVKANNMHIAEVDPPYAIDIISLKGENTSGIEHYNEISKKDYPDFLRNIAEGVYRALYEDSWCIWWFGPTWHEVVRDTLKQAGFKLDDIPAIWFKEGAQGVSHNPNIHLSRQYEPFFIARKGEPPLRARGRGNVFQYKPVPARGKIHPTERPIGLITDILQTFCLPNARVLVPFLGSGNTLLAAKQAGMGYSFGWDLSGEMKKRYMSRIVGLYGRD